MSEAIDIAWVNFLERYLASRLYVDAYNEEVDRFFMQRWIDAPDPPDGALITIRRPNGIAKSLNRLGAN